MLRRFWNAITAIFSNIFARKGKKVQAEIEIDNRPDNNWDQPIPMSTGITVPPVKQTFDPVVIPETVSKYATLIYAYLQGWSFTMQGNHSQANLWFDYIAIKCEKLLLKSALSGGIERRSLGDNSINHRSCAKSYQEFVSMSQRQRKLGVAKYVAAHKRYQVCQSVIDSTYSCISRLYMKVRDHASKGYPMPLRKMAELGAKAQDKLLLAYLCGVASRMLSEDKWGKHRADNDSTPVANRKPVTLTDTMDQTDDSQQEPVDIIIDQEVREAILRDIEMVLASKDQVAVEAWAARQSDRRQGEHGKGRNEWWKAFGMGKNKAYDITNPIQEHIFLKLEKYPDHILGPVLKEAVDTIANG